MKQSVFHRSLPILFLCSLLPLTALAQPKVWVTSSLERTAPSDPAGSGTLAQIYAAKGESESFQVVVQAPASGLTNVNFTVSNLSGPGGAVIPSTAFSLYREQYVYVDKSSVNWNGANQPLGAGWYADGLIPFTDPVSGAPIKGAQIEAVPFSLNAARNQPIWVDLLVPRTAAPGYYTGTFTVSSNQGSVTGTIGVTVWHFTLPVKPALKSAFLYWTSQDINADRELLRNRISPLRTNPKDQSQLIEMGLQTVGLPFYSGAAAGSCWMSAPPSLADLKASSAWQDPSLTKMVYSTDEVGNCTSLYPAIKQWGNVLHQAGVNNLATLPPIPALFDDGSGSGRSAIDIWTVMGLSYNADNVRAAIAKGDSVWSYTALVQDSYSPKWQIDFAPANYRIQPGFISQSLGLTGLLYWRNDYWSADPWNQVNTEGQFSSNNYPGEGMLVYPGAQVGIAGVAPSMRLKWIRDGVDDYDYVDMLKAAGRTAFAMDLSASVGADWSKWTRDPNALASVRLQLGQALDQAYGGTADSTSSSSSAATAPPPATTTAAPPAAPPVAPTNVAPGVVTVHPVNNGRSITFTYTVTDANGGADLKGAGLLLNAALNGQGACWFYYDLNTAVVSLADDAGVNWSSVLQGTGGTIANSQCSIAGTGFGAYRSGNNAIVTVTIYLKNFWGNKTIYIQSIDRAGLTSGYRSMGKWDLPN
jgi:hypothetical protein